MTFEEIERQYLSPPDFPDPDSQCDCCGEPCWEEELVDFGDEYGKLCQYCREEVVASQDIETREKYALWDVKHNGEKNFFDLLSQYDASDVLKAIKVGDPELYNSFVQSYSDCSEFEDYIRGEN